MAWVVYNPNPIKAIVGDCAVRAVSKATNQDWEHSYSALAVQGYAMADLPSANHVWGAYLRENGFIRSAIPNTCPDCYTVKDFCADNPSGTFVLALDKHVVTVVDGDYYDTWDSGNEPILYFWFKE